MISLSHFTLCPSVVSCEGIDHKQSLKFCIDTRKYSHPSVFVAIPGAKVNPLDMIEKLLEQGCPVVVYQKDQDNDVKTENLKKRFPKTKFISVRDSVTFLQEITNQHIESWQNANPKRTVFAISGSNGKTTHKEMLAHMLKTVLPGKIISTEKNNNNHLGVPLTLMEVSDSTEFVVLELGSNHPGEIKVLCDIAAPNAGLTTNVGATHLEFFGSEQKVFEEEAYLYHAVRDFTHDEGFFLINVDDPFLKKLPLTKGSVSYGESAGAMARISFEENGARMAFRGHDLIATNKHITGKHNKLNLITCLFIATHYYPELKQELVAAAAEFRPTKNRSEWIDFQGQPVFLDAYNANPSSMKAALAGFKESVLERGLKLSEACVVLGDMNELGDSAPRYHQEVGEYVKTLGLPNVFFVGRYASHYLKGFPQGHAKTSSAEFKSEYRSECLKRFAIHFIKGSRSLQLESLFDIT